MLHFLRKIRRSLIHTGSSRKYLIYAIGEIALVVIGILIALSINNWNERAKDRKKEVTYLKEIKKSLESDLNDELYPPMKLYQRRFEVSSILKENFYNSSNTSLSTDSISVLFNRIFSESWTFILKTDAFENLKSVGIDLITNDTLRSKISSLYGYSYKFLEKATFNLDDYYINSVYPPIFKNVRIPITILTSNELDYLLNDVHCINAINNIHLYSRFLIYQLKNSAKDVEELIIEIEEEIENLAGKRMN